MKFRENDLRPLRATLAGQPYLGGDSPTYADYYVFGAFQWATAISKFRLLEDGDPIAGWRHRMLELHGGLPETCRATRSDRCRRKAVGCRVGRRSRAPVRPGRCPLD
ncbi:MULTISPECIES: glutathione S-transferase C-terminal domain-containing protein [unclassified Bradyrhizobium]|uniref:glutathione S-transferase C-terminal domain-containing protein n=1 Tax=unclassified Bradyrhizobium TaxID=2631580 RepID=UPI00289E83BB|nr:MULTISPECIES: glutathione S-transferase C-terminal domain-containing protein [unclassified Bradyrhizobium]